MSHIKISIPWNPDTDGTVSDAFAGRPASAVMGVRSVELRGSFTEVIKTVEQALRPADPRYTEAMINICDAVEATPDRA